MGESKAWITITVNPQISAYAEYLVKIGSATSISAVFNEAMVERVRRDRYRRKLWDTRAALADGDRVSRMMAHVDSQLTSE